MIAVASVISQSFLFIMAIRNLTEGDNAFTFSIKSIHFKKNVVNPMLNLSFPVIVEKVAFALGKTVVNSMSKEYGSVTVGALGISNNINGITTQCQNAPVCKHKTLYKKYTNHCKKSRIRSKQC